MPAERTCRVEGCTSPHARTQLMCRRHWLGLPKPLRDELWKAYRSEEGILSDRYVDAAEACFAYWSQEPAR